MDRIKGAIEMEDTHSGCNVDIGCTMIGTDIVLYPYTTNIGTGTYNGRSMTANILPNSTRTDRNG